MEISISARHGTLAESDHDYIEKKIPRLTHVFGRLQSVKVTVDFKKREPEIEILVSAEHKHDFVARETHEKVGAAFDLALDKMEGQLRKYKERVQDHHKHADHVEATQGVEEDEE